MITITSHDLRGITTGPMEFPVTGAVGEATQPSKVGGMFDDDESFAEASDEGSSLSEEESDHEDFIIEGKEISHTNNFNYDSLTKGKVPSRRKLFRRRWRRVKTNKALIELKSKLEDALIGNCFLEEERNGISQNLRDITLWGVPLLPSKGHEGTDIVLLKFLKAQNYRVNEAFENLKQTLIWRAEQRIDDITNENLGDKKELNKMVFIDSVDNEGHPLCFNSYGAFKDKELYAKTFGTEQNRRDFLRWRVQFMEQTIKKLSFEPGGVDSFLLISDMKNVPGPGTRMKELGPMSKDVVSLFQRYYPELIYKHIILNAPFWYYLYHGVVTQYCTPGTREKFIFARPHKVTETLLKYIPPQNIPLQYGGFRRENDDEFKSDDPVLAFCIRGGAVTVFKLPISEVKVTVVWDVIVVGWDVSYKDKFIPVDEGSYKILLHTEEKVESCVRNSFYINEPGKIMISIKNATYVKKKVFIRLKSKATLPVYLYK
uniref:CRAL-TRIO domain-containing protein n=2 Tax=Chenopodium quinoa TaxID=63459 RepID=A0A803M7P6_CHEQI